MEMAHFHKLIWHHGNNIYVFPLHGFNNNLGFFLSIIIFQYCCFIFQSLWQLITKFILQYYILYILQLPNRETTLKVLVDILQGEGAGERLAAEAVQWNKQEL